MKKLYGILLTICFLFSGCATKNVIDKSRRTEMYVMVYDYENKGLQDVRIFIDDEEIGKTDIYGRYILALKEHELYTIQIQKNEYETIERDFIFNPMYVLYFQMGNSAQFLRLAEDAMDNGEYKEALVMLDRSIKLNNTRVDALYLKVIAYHKIDFQHEALALLQTLEQPVKDSYVLDDLKEQIVSSIEKGEAVYE